MNSNAAPFLGGFVMGGWSGFSIWDSVPPLAQVMTPTQIVQMYVIKLAVTLILGFLGGVTGMLGKDIYEKVKKYLNNGKKVKKKI